VFPSFGKKRESLQKWLISKPRKREAVTNREASLSIQSQNITSPYFQKKILLGNSRLTSGKELSPCGEQNFPRLPFRGLTHRITSF